MIIQESSVFCELTKQQLDKIIMSCLGFEIINYKLMLGGMFNTTYFVSTKSGEYILSVGPVNRHLIMPFEHNCMLTEYMIFDIMKQNGIPCSEVVHFDNSKTIIDRDFMVIKYIKSYLISDIEIYYPGQKANIMEKFAKEVKKIHSVKSKYFGRIQDVRDGKGFEKQSEFIHKELNDWISVAKNTDFFNRNDFVKLTTVFEKFYPLLDKVKEASLVHGDIALTNALITTEGNTPEIAAIIDPERGFWGDSEFDLAMIGYLVEDGFIKGYGDIFSCDEDTKIRRKVYELLRRMFDCYVWGAEYNQPQNMMEMKKFINNRITELMNY